MKWRIQPLQHHAANTLRTRASSIAPLLGMLLLCLAACPAQAASSLTNSLKGYTGTSQDNYPAQPTFLAGSGLEASFVYSGAGASGTWETIGFTSSGASFGAYHGGDGGRNYLRTTQADFFARSFTATVTVNRTNRSAVFFGMGTAALGTLKQPDVGTANASVYIELQNGYDNASRKVNGNGGNTQIAYSTMSSNGVTTVTGLMQLKMVYDATAKTAAFSIDYGADGSYEQNFAAFSVSSQVAEMVLGDRASIYFGSENGMVFSNFNATVVIPPVPPIGVILTNNIGVVSYYGQTLAFTAVVQTNGVTAANASSNVVFSLGSTPVWTNAVVNGMAYYTNTSLPAGDTNFTAQYLGDSNYQPTNVTVVQTVLKTTPTPTVTAPPTASAITYGQALGNSSLSGGSVVATNAYNNANVPGTFAFANPNSQPNVGTANYAIVFTPADTTNYNNATVTNVVSVTVKPVLSTAGTWKALPIISGQTPDTNGWSTVPVASQTNAQGTATAGWDVKDIKVCNDATNLYFLIELWPGKTNSLIGGLENYFWIDNDNNFASNLVNPDGTGVGAEDVLDAWEVWTIGVRQTLWWGMTGNWSPNANAKLPGADTGLYYEYSMALAATNTDGSRIFPTNTVTFGFSSRYNGVLQDMVPAFRYTFAPYLLGLTLTNNVGVTNSYGQTLVFTAVVQTNGVTAANAGSNVVFSLGGTPVWTNAVVNGAAYYTNASLLAGVTNLTAQYLGDTNYQPVRVTVTQSVLKTAPTLTPTLTASAIIYGQTLANSSLSGSVAATNAYNSVNVPGTFAFANPGLQPNVVGTTNVWVSFTPTDAVNYTTASNTVAVTVTPLLVSAGTWKSLPIQYGQTPDTAGWSTVPVASQTNAQGTATAGWDIKHIKVCNDATNLYLLVELWPGSTNNLQAGIENYFWIDGDNNPATGYVNADGTGVGAEDVLDAWEVWTSGVRQTFNWGVSVNSSPNANVVGPGGNPNGGWQADHGLYYEYSMALAATNTDGSLVFPSNTVTLGLGSRYNGVLQDRVPAFRYTFATAPLGTTNVFTSSPNPSGTGSNVTFTATIQTNGVTAAAATGTVQFRTNGVAFGSATLNSGVATLTTNALPHGSNTVVAAYLGDANFVGSTNSLVQVVNTPPVATNATYYRAKGLSLKIAITNLLSNVADADGDFVSLQSVGVGLTNATITADGNRVHYSPGTGAGGDANDVVSYTVSDGFGGMATANILINVYSPAGSAQMSIPTNGVVNLTFYGIPNYTYLVQTTTNLSVPWWTVSTNTAGMNGLWQFTDPNATNGQQYYRAAQP
jgi:hypothetical protein